MNSLRIGSLFSGAGFLDCAVEEVFNASTAWHCEWDKAASKVLARHWPDVPNHHDAAATDWATVEPVDIICGGSPCQDISTAGARAGMTEGTRSNLWVAMREAIATTKPAYVVWENVEGAASATATSEMESDPGLLGDHPAGQPVLRAYGRVLGDLAALGFDAEGVSLRASDVGACHGRRRRFVLAYHPGRVAALADAERGGRDGRALEPQRGTVGGTPVAGGGPRAGQAGADLTLLPTPAANLGECGGPQHPDKRRAGGHSVSIDDVVSHLLPTPVASEGIKPSNSMCAERRLETGQVFLTNEIISQWGTDPVHPTIRDTHGSWGEYEPAIRRAETAHGHPAPPPTEPGRNGNPRLSAQFAEWMMMAQPGWITDTPGVSRNDALKIAGNGVVQPQAAAALRHMLGTI